MSGRGKLNGITIYRLRLGRVDGRAVVGVCSVDYVIAFEFENKKNIYFITVFRRCVSKERDKHLSCDI